MIHRFLIAVGRDGTRAECTCSWRSPYYRPADFHAGYENASGDVVVTTDGIEAAHDAACAAGDEHLAEAA